MTNPNDCYTTPLTIITASTDDTDPRRSITLQTHPDHAAAIEGALAAAGYEYVITTTHAGSAEGYADSRRHYDHDLTRNQAAAEYADYRRRGQPDPIAWQAAEQAAANEGATDNEAADAGSYARRAYQRAQAARLRTINSAAADAYATTRKNGRSTTAAATAAYRAAEQLGATDDEADSAARLAEPAYYRSQRADAYAASRTQPD